MVDTKLQVTVYNLDLSDWFGPVVQGVGAGPAGKRAWKPLSPIKRVRKELPVQGLHNP